MSKRAVLGAWVIFCACALHAQRAPADQRNPFEGDPAAVQAGSALYAGRCADCHGADAKGSRGADLTRLWAAGVEDARVFASIRAGVPGSIMPPSFAPDNEIWAIVAYLRSISTVAPFTIAGADAHRGRELFVSLCIACHRVGDRGGSLGPDLTRIGEIRSREALTAAIREPNESIPTGYRAVTLVTRRGERIEGVAKSEDAFSIQIMDVHERLQGYRVADLDRVVRKTDSPMPAFRRDRLRERELDDLLQYLATLRAPVAPEESPP